MPQVWGKQNALGLKKIVTCGTLWQESSATEFEVAIRTSTHIAFRIMGGCVRTAKKEGVQLIQAWPFVAILAGQLAQIRRSQHRTKAIEVVEGIRIFQTQEFRTQDLGIELEIVGDDFVGGLNSFRKSKQRLLQRNTVLPSAGRSNSVNGCGRIRNRESLRPDKMTDHGMNSSAGFRKKPSQLNDARPIGQLAYRSTPIVRQTRGLGIEKEEHERHPEFGQASSVMYWLTNLHQHAACFRRMNKGNAITVSAFAGFLIDHAHAFG